MFDILITGGTVVDGTDNNPAFKADVAIQGDTIAEIGQLAGAAARQQIDATGKTVAPGFIDVHTHSDGWPLSCPSYAPKTLQGFTTELLALDGISYAPVNEENWRDWFFYLNSLNGLRLDQYTGWQTLDEYHQQFHKTVAQNTAVHIPYANVRAIATGFGPRPLDDQQRRIVRNITRQSMEAGAVGISTGLDYIAQCHASTEELIDACTVVAEFGGLYATHIRYKSGFFQGLNEALEICESSGARLHVSHLKTWDADQLEQLLEWIDKNARPRVDFTFDIYPYGPGSTMLNFFLPYEVWDNGPLDVLRQLREPAIRARFGECLKHAHVDLPQMKIAGVCTQGNQHLLGKSLAEVVEEAGQPAGDVLADLLIEERLAVLCVVIESGPNRKALLDPLLTHPCGMIGTDGIWNSTGPVHPRQYGSVGRLLGHHIRERNMMPLEQCIASMTSRPAQTFGLTKRGQIQSGYMADVVVFDAETIIDQATFENPRQTTLGVETVLVNGQPIVENQKTIEYGEKPWPGCALPARYKG